jgi:DNA-binding MarR family transcriptional regulator
MASEKRKANGPLPVPATDNALLSDLLWEVAAYVELLTEAALAGLPVTTATSGTLMTIYGEPGVTIAEMARRKPRTQQAISQNVARLEKLGLIERRLGPGRGIGLHPTDDGRALAEQAFDRERAADEQVRQILGPDHHEALRQLLVESRGLLRARR